MSASITTSSRVEDNAKIALSIVLGLLPIRGTFDLYELLILLTEDDDLSMDEAYNAVQRLVDEGWLRHKGKGTRLRYTLGRL
jgi:hypothetical protein